MRVRFWGTRGSLPVSLTAEAVREKIGEALLLADGRRFASSAEAQDFVRHSMPFAVGQSFGGQSSCVELEFAAPTAARHEYFLCDMGSGARVFGNGVLARHGPRTANVFHVFMSHLHWDHIMGFPFFTPAYIPGNIIRIYGCHQELELAFRRQQEPPSFPVRFEQLGATIEFVTLTPGQTTMVAGVKVTPKLQLHAGDSYGYRFARDGRSVIYSTDAEHKQENAEHIEAFADFLKDADLVIFDAMYSLADSVSVKEDWGHSSNVVGVELCQLAGAKHLVLFHHEPIFSDLRIAGIEAETRRLESITREGSSALQITAAYDGLVIEL